LAHHELPEFQKFIKDYWVDGHLFGLETSLFNWQHKELDAFNCMVAKHGEEIVGVFCFIPLCHFDKSLPKTQIFLSLFRVLENKGIGIGYYLYKSILSKYNPEFMAGTTMNPRMNSFHEWQGFKVGIMDHHVVMSPFVNEFKVAKVPKMLKIQSRKINSSVTFVKLTPKDLHDLATETLYLHQLPLKSDVYIINRFMFHPVYSYDVYAVSDNKKLQALCVIRPIIKDGSVVLRFVDFIGPNKSFSVLYDFLIDLLKMYNAEYIDIYSYGVPSIFLQEAGFIDRNKIDSLIIPNYFEPFDRRNVEVRFACKCLQTYPPIRLFKADGDQDRPSQIPGVIECFKN